MAQHNEDQWERLRKGAKKTKTEDRAEIRSVLRLGLCLVAYIRNAEKQSIVWIATVSTVYRKIVIRYITVPVSEHITCDPE